MKLHKESHVDHGLSAAQLAHVLLTFESREEPFFIETITLPADLGTVPCSLYGPIMGDVPIDERYCDWIKRGDRLYTSRRLVEVYDQIPSGDRRVNTLTVIAGMYEGACILYTVFGGPLAPKEQNDPTLAEDKREESVAFWSQHALAF